jgi:hypothetical protein
MSGKKKEKALFLLRDDRVFLPDEEVFGCCW